MTWQSSSAGPYARAAVAAGKHPAIAAHVLAASGAGLLDALSAAAAAATAAAAGVFTAAEFPRCGPPENGSKTSQGRIELKRPRWQLCCRTFEQFLPGSTWSKLHRVALNSRDDGWQMCYTVRPPLL